MYKKVLFVFSVKKREKKEKKKKANSVCKITPYGWKEKAWPDASERVEIIRSQHSIIFFHMRGMNVHSQLFVNVYVSFQYTVYW